MKGRMEAENLAACCLRKKMNLGCHGSEPRGTGVHVRCWGVNSLLIGSRGSCKLGFRDWLELGFHNSDWVVNKLDFSA